MPAAMTWQGIRRGSVVVGRGSVASGGAAAAIDLGSQVLHLTSQVLGLCRRRRYSILDVTYPPTTYTCTATANV